MKNLGFIKGCKTFELALHGVEKLVGICCSFDNITIKGTH